MHRTTPQTRGLGRPILTLVRARTPERLNRVSPLLVIGAALHDQVPAHPTAGTGGLEAIAPAAATAVFDQGDMWRNAHSHGAVADGRPSLTSVPLTSFSDDELAVWLCWLSRYLFSDVSWAHCFGRRLFQLLRADGAQRAAVPVPETDVPDTSQSDDVWALSEVPFVLMAPEFQDERLTLHMVLPQSVTETIDLLDTSRGRTGFELFPNLCTVHPLPRIDAVAVVMLPSWLADRAIICLDVTQCGGGAFAAVSEVTTDRFALLNMAGFAAASEIQIFSPYADEPVEAEAVITVSNGDCFRFLPPSASLRPFNVLSALLADFSSATFEPRPSPEVTDRYCLVGEGFYCAFELYPERARFYRADIASRMELPVMELLLSQARPRIQDAVIYGSPCRTVVAVGAESESPSILQGTIGLLDCRPILEGWRRLLAPGGWVDLHLLRGRLSQGAPVNHEVCLSGCAAHWRWLWLEPGQVLQVTYQASVSGPDDFGDLRPAQLLQPNSFEIMDSVRSPQEQPTSDGHPAQAADPQERSSGYISHMSDPGVDARMWVAGLKLAACLPGILWLTTGAPFYHLGTYVFWAFLARLSRGAWHHYTWTLFCFLLVEHLSALGVDAVQLRAIELATADPSHVVRAAVDACPEPGTACHEAFRRHIPTPCRAHRPHVVNISGAAAMGHSDGLAPFSSTSDEIFQGLHTLLDIAGREPDCPAFFLAATLLDTLVEHFTPVCAEHVAVPAVVPPRVLSLDSLLPHGIEQLPGSVCTAEVFDLTARQCALPCTPDMLRALTSPLDFSFLQPPMGRLPRPERFREWTSRGQPGRSPAPGETLVLTADGSFDPELGLGGWAVVASLVSDDDFLLPGQFVGCIAGSTRELQIAIGDAYSSNSAYLSEVAGLLWAALLALRLPGFAPTVFRADNIGALQGVSGHAHMRDHPLCHAAGAVHAALRIRKGHPSYQHVLGHAADAANELADALAGRASAQHRSFSLPGLDLSLWFSSQSSPFDWLPHLCLQESAPVSLPAQHMDVMSWNCDMAPLTVTHSDLFRPFLRAVDGVGPSITHNKPHCVDCRLVSFNVLSLLEHLPNSHAAGMHGETGRVKLLCSTFEALDICLAGLQECRTPKGDMHCQSFHRFSSGKDEHSCFGVELWVADKGPFDHRSVTILHAEPTLMLAGLAFLGRPLRILVAHGPHRVHPEAFRAAWWDRARKLCMAHHRNAPFIVLSDANCRVGSDVDSSVGPHQADAEDFSGALFRSLLADLGCWLPSTFASTAWGPGGTLYQRRSQEWVRSDYVALPQEWHFKNCVAWVEPSISAGHQCLDHLAVAASFCLLSPVQVRPGAKAKRIDVGAVSHPENRHVVDHVLSTAPQVSWDVDASEHVAALVDHIYRGLAAHFPQDRRPMRGTHFSDLTQRLHGAVSALRHSIRTRDEAYRKAMLRCVLLAWSAAGPAFSSIFAGRWLWMLQIRRALDCMLLRRFGRALRTSCRQDRRVQLELLSEKVSEAPCAELHKAVQQLMRPKKFRKAGTAPLPLLRKSDGSVCESQEEITRVWRDHFRVLEAGKEVGTADLAFACSQRQAAFEGTERVDARLVPTWAQLQSAFKATSPHKACGPDLLPPAICTLFSQRLTEVFWPVMLKAILRSNEAVGLKGGIMHRIAKPSAVANTTAGYRGILVQSCLSKVLHRAVRRMAVDHWSKHMLTLQIGGRKGCPASFGHFCSRAFLHMAKAQGRSAAILFVDIAAAYYGVIREAVLGSCASGRPLEDLVASLDLTQEDLQHLTWLVEHEPVLREQGAADLFAEVANELHRNTWFVLAGDSQIVETHRGTRPGGSLADVVFNILFSKVLQRRSSSVLQPCIPLVPWNGNRTPWPASTAVSVPRCPVEASDVVYADDLASFLISPSAEALPGAVSGVAADTIDTLLPHGLIANIGPTKTAAIVAPAGPGSRSIRRQIFSEKKGRLTVLPENKGGFRLDLVPVYKHLGSLVTHDGCLLPEIRNRLGAGRAAMKEGKQRLFACRAIPLRRRSALFRAHVLASVTPGMGTWPLLNQQEWQTFSGGIISLYRQLLCLRAEGGFHCSEAQILSRVGLPAPESLLHAERLRFLGQMVRSGPDAAWALLAHYSSFQSALRAAADWLLAAVRSVCDLGDIVVCWGKWEALMRTSPGAWKSLIRRAETWHSLRVEQLEALESFGRRTWPAKAVPASAPIETCEHACLQCHVAFATRQQWGAHAHRVHGYHSRAHQIARGRECQACGLRVASEAKLRTHLRLSLACVQQLERLQDAGDLRADLSQGHALEPAQPGIGRAALGPAAPEFLPALSAALESFLPPSKDVDESLFELVKAFVAPLPVLRATLQAWGDRLPPGEVRAACEDVLLVLHPQYLCDRISGGGAPRFECCTPFSPRIEYPIEVGAASALPVVIVGPEPPPDFRQAFDSQCHFAQSTFPGLLARGGKQVAGACVAFPMPPSHVLPVFSPSSCAIKDLRVLRQWTDEALKGLEFVIGLARMGRRVHVRMPIDSLALQPLGRWLQAMTQQEKERGDAFSSFTLEFNFVSCLH